MRDDATDDAPAEIGRDAEAAEPAPTEPESLPSNVIDFLHARAAARASGPGAFTNRGEAQRALGCVPGPGERRDSVREHGLRDSCPECNATRIRIKWALENTGTAGDATHVRPDGSSGCTGSIAEMAERWRAQQANGNGHDHTEPTAAPAEPVIPEALHEHVRDVGMGEIPAKSTTAESPATVEAMANGRSEHTTNGATEHAAPPTLASSVLEWALFYAQLDWYVLPVWGIVDGHCACPKREACDDRQGKHPITKHGLKDATTDEAQIRKWWKRWPAANVGISLERSGLVAFDVDTPEAHTVFAALEVEHSEMREMPRQQSGSGNLHVLAKKPGFAIRGMCRQRITMRGKNYIVAAPSLHRSGGRYAWIEGREPWSIGSFELPIALAEELKRHQATTPAKPSIAPLSNEVQVKRARAFIAKMDPAIEGQHGHDKLFAACCRAVHGFGLSNSDALHVILDAFNPRCSPPWGDDEIDEVERKIDQAQNECDDPERWRVEDRPANAHRISHRPEPTRIDFDDSDRVFADRDDQSDEAHHSNGHTKSSPAADYEAAAPRSEDRHDQGGENPEDDIPPPGDEDVPDTNAAKPSAATALVTLALRECELWRSTDGDPYATITVEGHREHILIGSPAFRQWLARLGWHGIGRTVGNSSIKDAAVTLAGFAAHEGQSHRAEVRVAGDGTHIWIDLVDSAWQAIEIDANGWRIVSAPPVRFVRRKAMAALPAPVGGGALAELRDHVRVSDESWPLVAGWLVGAMSPTGPYPVLVYRGQHGAGKSWSARILRSLIDPSVAPIRSEPREPRDLVITAKSSHVVALDNLSSLPSWLSDGLCRLSTGGGYAARALFTDADEIVIDVQRPVILTGITDVVTAPDLLDRTLLVELDAIGPGERKTERELGIRWASAQPRILGALCDAVSCALRRRGEVLIDDLPRLADWATWATAAEPELGLGNGAVLEALETQKDEKTEIALEASIIAKPLRELVEARIDKEWSGTAAELLIALNNSVDAATVRDKAWPRTARGLAGALIRITHSLRATGLVVERVKPGELARGKRGFRIQLEAQW